MLIVTLGSVIHSPSSIFAASFRCFLRSLSNDINLYTLMCLQPAWSQRDILDKVPNFQNGRGKWAEVSKTIVRDQLLAQNLEAVVEVRVQLVESHICKGLSGCIAVDCKTPIHVHAVVWRWGCLGISVLAVAYSYLFHLGIFSHLFLTFLSVLLFFIYFLLICCKVLKLTVHM